MAWEEQEVLVAQGVPEALVDQVAWPEVWEGLVEEEVEDAGRLYSSLVEVEEEAVGVAGLHCQEAS